MKYITILLAVMLLTSCTMLEKWFDDSGMPSIELVLVDDAGAAYTIAYDPDTGLAIAGQYTASNGMTYTITPEGGFEVTDPNGNIFRLTPRE